MNVGGFSNSMEKSGNSKDIEYDRPLKKAKYVWQLKGKYHLKDVNKNGHSNFNKIKENVKRKYLKNKRVEFSDDDDCSVYDLTNSNAVLPKNKEPIKKNSIIYSFNEPPISMVLCDDDSERFLHNWQIKRIEESFVENAINTMLEQLGISPADAAEFVENCTNGGEVVDEGILMAIQSHGLQPAVSIRENYTSVNTINSVLNDQTCNVIDSNSIKENINRDHIEQTQISRISSNCLCEVIERNNSNYVDDTVDFLSAAVSVAIEKKGLSYSH